MRLIALASLLVVALVNGASLCDSPTLNAQDSKVPLPDGTIVIYNWGNDTVGFALKNTFTSGTLNFTGLEYSFCTFGLVCDTKLNLKANIPDSQAPTYEGNCTGGKLLLNLYVYDDSFTSNEYTGDIFTSTAPGCTPSTFSGQMLKYSMTLPCTQDCTTA